MKSIIGHRIAGRTEGTVAAGSQTLGHERSTYHRLSRQPPSPSHMCAHAARQTALSGCKQVHQVYESAWSRRATAIQACCTSPRRRSFPRMACWQKKHAVLGQTLLQYPHGADLPQLVLCAENSCTTRCQTRPSGATVTHSAGTLKTHGQDARLPGLES
jgi:hypothetical protein